MQILLFLLFIGLPIAEIAIFIQAGRALGGALPVILLTVGTSILGVVLMRVQGIATISQLSQSISRGEAPVTPVMDGFGVMIAGMLMLLPGFLTDALGLLLFIPPVRRAFLQRIGSGMFGRAPAGTKRDDPIAEPVMRPRQSRDRFKKSADVIDAEFETIYPPEEDNKTAPDGKPRVNGHKSPWRRS